MLALGLFAIAGCAPESSRRVPDYWPTASWRTSTPERQGMDSTMLAGALGYITEHDLALHSLLIVRHGYVVLDAHFYPSSGTELHDVASVTKSITTTLIGIAIDKGYIKDVERPVLDYFPEINAASLSADKKRITIRHLLSMSSGLNCGYRPGEAELFAMLQSKDWARFTLDLPMVARPGAEFAYCSGGMHLLSAVITRATGMSALEFARAHLFAPLGIKEVVWPADPQGNSDGWGDLRLHPYDMAKIGYLYLNGGQWNGRQVLSAKWVEEATRTQIAVPAGKGGYGYGWWISPKEFAGMYEARGRGEQRIIVWPEKDLVVVVTAGGKDLGVLAPFLVKALRSEQALPERPDAYRELQRKVGEAAVAPKPKPVAPLPATAAAIADRLYRLSANKLGLTALSLHFELPDEARLRIDLGKRTFILPVGLDGVYRFASAGPSSAAVALKGNWRADNRFVLHYAEVAGANNFLLDMTFDGDAIAIQVDDPTGYFTQLITGKTPGE